MSEEITDVGRRWAFAVDFHTRLNAIDSRAEIKTIYEDLTPDFTFGAVTHTRRRAVGERLALHDKLLGLDTAPDGKCADCPWQDECPGPCAYSKYFHWLGGTQ